MNIIGFDFGPDPDWTAWVWFYRSAREEMNRVMGIDFFLEVRSDGDEGALLGFLPAPAIRPPDGVMRYPRVAMTPAFLRPQSLVRKMTIDRRPVDPPLMPWPPVFPRLRDAPILIRRQPVTVLALSFGTWVDHRGEREILRCPVELYDALFDVTSFEPAT